MTLLTHNRKTGTLEYRGLPCIFSQHATPFHQVAQVRIGLCKSKHVRIQDFVAKAFPYRLRLQAWTNQPFALLQLYYATACVKIAS